jgi:hypothetical protein
LSKGSREAALRSALLATLPAAERWLPLRIADFLKHNI